MERGKLQKSKFRTKFRDYRKQLSPADYFLLSREIVEQAKSVIVRRGASVVHCYWPLINKREIDVRPLIQWLLAEGIQVVLPVVTSFTKERSSQPRMKHLLYDPGDTLVQNKWGIEEPIGGKGVPLETIDTIVVPALGADAHGNRVGNGFGYYDELLSATRATSICLVYSACLVDLLPADTHDMPISLIITENQIVSPERDVTS